MSFLKELEVVESIVPLKDSIEQGSVYRSILYKTDTVKRPKDTPSWRRRVASWLTKLSKVVEPSHLMHTCEVPVKDELYPLVVYLKETCGYSFIHALVIASSMCKECVNYALMELEYDTHSLMMMSKFTDVSATCPTCRMRKKVYFARLAGGK